MTWKHNLVVALRRVGVDVSRYQPDRNPLARRGRLMRNLGVELVLDVGANTGGFAQEIRGAGYAGRLVSYEPISHAFAFLEKYSANDPSWEVYRYALGASQGKMKINVSNNLTSSSLLPMLAAHEEAAPHSKYVGDEEIEVKTLDEVFPVIRKRETQVWLKVDTQGYEMEVLAGGRESLRRIQTVQLEVSLVPLYQGAATYQDILDYMKAEGFAIADIQPGFCDNATGRLLQADFTFHRKCVASPKA